MRADPPIFADPYGRVAEGLGTALQKLLLRFESARDLDRPMPRTYRGIGLFRYAPIGSLVHQYLGHTDLTRSALCAKPNRRQSH